MPTPELTIRPSPMTVTLDGFAWPLDMPTKCPISRQKVALGCLVSKDGGVLARRRLSSPLVSRRLPILPVWLGRPRSDLHAQKRVCPAVPGCLGWEGTGYPTATWPDWVDPPQVTSASSLTSPAQPGFRLHAAAAAAAAAAASSTVLWVRRGKAG